jgi:predicted nuclease of restriction endonuclease-like (RecB) superfamily
LHGHGRASEETKVLIPFIPLLILRWWKPIGKSVKNEIQETEPKTDTDYVLKDPYILEFLDLKENRDYHESELEQALINKLQEFLLELGKGFSFVARQKRITLDGDHVYIDLVFYNYILKCFVIIDLKTNQQPRPEGRGIKPTDVIN